MCREEKKVGKKKKSMRKKRREENLTKEEVEGKEKEGRERGSNFFYPHAGPTHTHRKMTRHRIRRRATQPDVRSPTPSEKEVPSTYAGRTAAASPPSGPGRGLSRVSWRGGVASKRRPEPPRPAIGQTTKRAGKDLACPCERGEEMRAPGRRDPSSPPKVRAAAPSSSSLRLSLRYGGPKKGRRIRRAAGLRVPTTRPSVVRKKSLSWRGSKRAATAGREPFLPSFPRVQASARPCPDSPRASSLPPRPPSPPFLRHRRYTFRLATANGASDSRWIVFPPSFLPLGERGPLPTSPPSRIRHVAIALKFFS